MRGLRPILIAGFAGMLFIFGVAAIQAVRLLGAMRVENQILRQQTLDNSRRLATVRYCVLLSQKYMNDPAASETEMRDQWMKMLSDLSGAQLTQLRGLLNQHWAILNHAILNHSTQTAHS